MNRTPPANYVDDDHLASILAKTRDEMLGRSAGIAMSLAETLDYERGVTKDRAESDAQALLDRQQNDRRREGLTPWSARGLDVHEAQRERDQAQETLATVVRDRLRLEALVRELEDYRDGAEAKFAHLHDAERDRLFPEREMAALARTRVALLEGIVREKEAENDELRERAQVRQCDHHVLLSFVADDAVQVGKPAGQVKVNITATNRLQCRSDECTKQFASVQARNTHESIRAHAPVEGQG